MSTGKTGRCLVSLFYIRLVSAEDICLVSTADICPVSTADICPVSTEDIWLLWVHLGTDENDFDPFFRLKCAKWNTEAGAAGAAEAPQMQPQAAARSLVPHAPGSGLREFINKLPQMMNFLPAAGRRPAAVVSSVETG